jgi:predicted transcriptional regulator
MKNDISEDELWSLIGFIKISSTRFKIMQTLQDEHLMPSEITQPTEIIPSQVSIALRDLKAKKLVKCVNEKTKKGRMYCTTPLGEKAFKKMIESI